MPAEVRVLPFRLQESPASFQATILGTTWKDPVTGYEYQIVKSTAAAALSPGMGVTKETASLAFEVDEANSQERIYGIVANQLTGTTVAVSDAFWVQRTGICYGLKCGSGHGAIVVLGPVYGSSGYLHPFTGHVHSMEAAYLADKWNVQALEAKTTQVAGGTQMLIRIT